MNYKSIDLGNDLLGINILLSPEIQEISISILLISLSIKVSTNFGRANVQFRVGIYKLLSTFSISLMP